MKIIGKIMRAWDRLSCIIAGIVGSFTAIGILHWFALPDHNTIDMLSFTESAFGIGMTVIALVFSLVLVNQVKEIDRRFDEKSKETDAKLNNALEKFAQLTHTVGTKQMNLQQTEQVAASGMIVGPSNMANLRTINVPGSSGIVVTPNTSISGHNTKATIKEQRRKRSRNV